MEAKHTPGPWVAKNTSGAGLSVHADVSKALGERYSKDCPIYHVASDACGLQISYELWTQFPREGWDAMQAANARLIAAAPDLLAACEMAVQTFIVSCRPVGNPDVDDAAEIRGMVATLRSAIAKATQ